MSVFIGVFLGGFFKCIALFAFGDINIFYIFSIYHFHEWDIFNISNVYGRVVLSMCVYINCQTSMLN